MNLTKGLAIFCDNDFNIIKVLRDDFSIINFSLINLTFLRIIEKSSLQRAFSFQKEIVEHKAAFNWELNLQNNSRIDLCYLTGVKEQDKIIIIATKDSQNLKQFYQEYQAIFNDKINLLKGSKKGKAEIKRSAFDYDIFNEFSRINNELTNLQRELSKKNVKMDKQQKQLELINHILRHDLANHFNVILSAIKLYEKVHQDDFLREISKRALKGTNLIQYMKKLESVFDAKAKIYSVQVKPLILKVVIEYSDITFDLEDLQDAEIIADDSLEIIFDNLIRNAIRHGKTDKMRFSSKMIENKYILEIADFGKGIPDEIKSKIFDENFKSGTTGNTGLGLFIVHQIMKNYRGNILVKDNLPQGAIFELKFLTGRNVR